jgi:signal transduction histidine kinase
MQAAPLTARPGAGRPQLEPVTWTLAAAALSAAALAGQVGGESAGYLSLDIAAGAVSVSLLPLLRRWSVPVTLLLTAAAALSPAATPAATLAVLLLAQWRPLAVAAEVAAVGIAAHLIRELWRPVGGLPYGWWTVLTVAAYAALVGWGTMLRANRALIASLRERAEQAEAEQARRVAEARAAERTRIAREMHDVLAHRLSLLATYAGALSYRPDAPAEQLSRAAEVVRAGAHEALDELREVIGLLRDDELTGEQLPDVPDGGRPVPGLADLQRLIEESREAGVRVDVREDVRDAANLPGALGRTVYRVVQEGLTNARKHAPGAAVSVAVGGGPSAGLTVELVNPLADGAAGEPAGAPVPGTGTGLIGLAERAELAGGRLAYRADGGEFRLTAWLPWAAP